MIPLKYATASQEIPLGPFVDDTDGKTAETGLTIANTDIQLWKSGATTLANKNSGGGTHISDGIYYATLDATDTNTYGPLVLFVAVSGALAIKVECWVMEADAYDALLAASGTGHLDVDLTGLNDPAASAIADAVLDEALSGHTDAGSLGKAIADIETDATAILADTDEMQSDDVPSLISGLNDPTAAAISDAVWDEAIGDHVGAGSTGKKLSDGAQTDELPSSPPSAATIADAVLDEALSGHTGAGTLGKALADVETDVTAILDDTGSAGVVISTATAQAIADEILKRSVSNTEDAADAHSLTAIILAALESSLSGTTWTIKKTDGSTTFTTKTVTTNASAEPITAVT